MKRKVGPSASEESAIKGILQCQCWRTSLASDFGVMELDCNCPPGYVPEGLRRSRTRSHLYSATGHGSRRQQGQVHSRSAPIKHHGYRLDASSPTVQVVQGSMVVASDSDMIEQRTRLARLAFTMLQSIFGSKRARLTRSAKKRLQVTECSRLDQCSLSCGW